MSKVLHVILIGVAIFDCGGDASKSSNRSTFPAKLRYCRWFCAVRDSQLKNTIQTCYVLADHQNTTVTKCVNRCLIRHEEDSSNTTECQCQGGKCTGKSAAGSPSTSTSASDLTTSSMSSTSEIPTIAQSSSTENSSTISPNTETTANSIATSEFSSQRFNEINEDEYYDERISE